MPTRPEQNQPPPLPFFIPGRARTSKTTKPGRVHTNETKNAPPEQAQDETSDPDDTGQQDANEPQRKQSHAESKKFVNIRPMSPTPQKTAIFAPIFQIRPHFFKFAPSVNAANAAEIKEIYPIHPIHPINTINRKPQIKKTL